MAVQHILSLPMAEEKPFPATQKKLQEARKRGQVLRSPILIYLFQVVSCLVGVLVLSEPIWVYFKILLEYWTDFRSINLWALLTSLLWLVSLSSFCCLALSGLSSILMTQLLVGLRLEFAPLIPKFDNFGLGSFNARIVTGLKGSWQIVLKIGFFGLMSYMSIRDLIVVLHDQTIALPFFANESILELIFTALKLPLIAMFLLGLLELLVQRYKLKCELGMTCQEVKLEHREQEGSPEIKGVRSCLARSMTYGELVERIKSSKVIVVRAKA